MKPRSALKPSTMANSVDRAARCTIRLALRLAGASVLTLGHAGCARGVDLGPETLASSGGFAGGAGTHGGDQTGGAGGTFGSPDSSSSRGGTNAGLETEAAADQGGETLGDSSAAGGGPNDASLQGDRSFPPGGMIGSCTPTQWRVSASNSAPLDPPMNAIDGMSTTRWSTGTGQSAGQYYQIDFGGYVELSQIVLDNTGSTGDHPRGYLVEISNDGINFSQQVIASGTLPDVPAVTIVTIAFSVKLVRYLRIEMTGASGSWWSITELHAMCQVPDGG
jgi:hypothetical protein